jgi:hypothetical protein
MKEFNAQQARDIVGSLHIQELNSILVGIKKEAENGGTVYYIYSYLEEKTIKELEEKGFELIRHSSISIQKDGLYYSISWA